MTARKGAAAGVESVQREYPELFEVVVRVLRRIAREDSEREREGAA